MDRTDKQVMEDGLRLLIEGLGLVDAERFIGMLFKEPFDYTKWKEHLFSDMSIRELSRVAKNATME